MKIYEFLDYKLFIRRIIEQRPTLGRGAIKKMASVLRVHPSLISQILSGTKDFSVEQANDLAMFFNLTEEETEYFLCLVGIERAGTTRLKIFLQNKRDRLIKSRSNAVQSPSATRVSKDFDSSKFYSNWCYSAIHLLTGIPKFQKVEAISEYLKLPLGKVQEAIDYLSDLGMVEENDGLVRRIGDQDHERHEGSNAVRHHINWRLRALERLHKEQSEEQFLTMPIRMSHSDRKNLQTMISEFVSKLKVTVEPSMAEGVSMVTIDLFDIA